ncbi:hypothetical protein [Burkholderia sp. Bp9031]|uniref:hypothetical protein n=1 Tax=Burkholderia sp. Bp9031 TaxID=2184566 RepID=UPI001639B21C|nr:hypothetical protein [Burkholderia sp. Bp9031]
MVDSITAWTEQARKAARLQLPCLEQSSKNKDHYQITKNRFTDNSIYRNFGQSNFRFVFFSFPNFFIGIFDNYYRFLDYRKTNCLSHPQTCIRRSGLIFSIFCSHGMPAHGIRFSDRKYVNMVLHRKCSAIENMRVIVAITGLHYSQAASLLPELSTNDLPGNPADERSS